MSGLKLASLSWSLVRSVMVRWGEVCGRQWVVGAGGWTELCSNFPWWHDNSHDCWFLLLKAQSSQCQCVSDEWRQWAQSVSQSESRAENVIFRAEVVPYDGWVWGGMLEVLYDGPDCLHVRLQLWPIQTSSQCKPAPGQQTCHLHEQRRPPAASQLSRY